MILITIYPKNPPHLAILLTVGCVLLRGIKFLINYEVMLRVSKSFMESIKNVLLKIRFTT